jgi:hypothetical protein
MSDRHFVMSMLVAIQLQNCPPLLKLSPDASPSLADFRESIITREDHHSFLVTDVATHIPLVNHACNEAFCLVERNRHA